jgi:hypothetical protein
MPTVSDYFDATKQYKEIEIQPGALVVADDISLIQDINNYDRRETAKFLQGFQLKIQALTNAPVLKVKANNDLTEGQVITIEMIDATHAKWKKNSGAWSASIAVTSDDVTWNTLGTSGLDVVFSSTAVASDESEIWVAQGMRLLGGAITAPVANSFTLGVGKWSILGEFEDFTVAKTVAGTSDDDYLYLKVETNEVAYTTDSELGTRLADGEYDPNSIIAHDREYTLMAGSTFPDNTTSPYVEYVIVGKVINAAAGTFAYMWDEPNDIQKIMRIYGDTMAPSTPTGLTLTTGSELGYVTGTIDRAYSQVPINGYLKASCDINSETDVDYYEFKFVRLAAPGGAITTDSFTQIVRLNNDAGGMSVPTGVNFTLRNQTFGVPYGVFVRAVDYAGNASSWSARVDEVIGGSTSGISAVAVGPTFTLTDTAGFVGVDVNITALPANCEGFGIWVQEGSYPTTSPGTEWGIYNADVGTVSIPWKESGKPYIRIRGFDENGIYQALSSEGNVSLAASAQLAVTTHDDSLLSHGGLLTGIADIESRYGRFEKWAAVVESQGFAIQDTYLVSSEGGFYSTVQGALNAIAEDEPSQALVLVSPNAEPSTPIVIPDLTNSYGATVQIIIQGLGGQASLGGDLDVSNLSTRPTPLSSPVTEKAAQLVLKDLVISGRIYGTKTAVPIGSISFDNCLVVSSEPDPLIDLDARAGGGWYVFAKNSSFINFGTAYVMEFQGFMEVFVENCNICLYNNVEGTAVYFGEMSSANIRRFDGCKIDVNGSTTGLAFDASAAIDLFLMRSDYRRANGANVTLAGSSGSNQVWTTDFIYA